MKIEITQRYPSIEDLTNTVGRLEYNDKDKLICGDFCRVHRKYAEIVGKNVILKEIIKNMNNDAAQFPYFATHVEIIK